MNINRRLAAILVADVVGYSRLIGVDESGTLARLHSLRQDIIDPNIAKHSGRLFKTVGDGFLVEFASAVQAVNCAIAIQKANSTGSLPLRIGVHVGDVMVQDDDLMGDGVNIAARIEGIAEPGGITISRAVHEQVRDRIEVGFEDKGEIELKNIARPVQVFAVAGVKTTTSTVGAAPALTLPDKPSIAVLPFQNMSGDPEQEYFADGMVEDIITALSRFSSLFVIARNSTFTYKGKSVDIKQVGRELDVRYVLEGSVRKAGGRVRITGQLIEAATNAHLWADRFEGNLDDVFALQDRITSSVVGIVEPKIHESEIRYAQLKPTRSLNAHDCVLRALPKYRMWSREANQEAQKLFSRAVEHDPHNAAALMHLSWCYAQRWMQSWTDDRPREISEGRRLSERALELGQNDPSILAGCAFLRIQYGADAASALPIIDKAIGLNPNMSGVMESSAWIRIRSGDPELVVEHCMRALQLNPFNQTKTPLAIGYFLLGRKDEALACVEEAVANAPRSLPALRFAATIRAGFGELEEARRLVQRCLGINPNSHMGPVGPWTPEREPHRQRYLDARRLLVQLGLPE